MTKKPTTRSLVSANEVFSDYVAQLGPAGEPPDMNSYLEVREGLRAVLVTELRRRGLWHSPPAFLGASGANWSEGGLDELVSDAYSFIFFRRLRGLRDQQRLKGNIRPMVVLNVRHFLTELQAKADPLGYRVFGRLRAAVQRAIDRRQIFVLNAQTGKKKDRLSNGSLLGFQPAPRPLTARADLTEPVRRWNDELLPELITAEGRAVPKVVKRLAEKMRALETVGVAAFRFGDLIAELKGDVRRRWDSVWRGTVGEHGKEPGLADEPWVSVPVTRPDEQPDWPRHLMLIQDCVAISIDQQRPPGNRRDLWSLWTLIRSTRLLPGEGGPLPSYTELGRQLELTRDRVRQLFGRLKPLVLACLGADAPLVSLRETSRTPKTNPSGRPVTRSMAKPTSGVACGSPGGGGEGT